LRAGRQRLLQTRLPELAMAMPAGGGLLDPRSIFPFAVSSVWLEIGFGAGEHIAWQAAANPRLGLIACEVYVNGVASLLAHIERQGLANIRIHHGDGLEVIDALPEASIGRAFVLFADPWPKARHHKRRLIGEQGLARLARILRDGAELRLATDHVGYLRWMLQHILRSPHFEWTAGRPADFRQRPADWPATRFESKAASQGRPATYLRLTRRSR
jgi:tRNA (guanine-N7-)-methyltransferase